MYRGTIYMPMSGDYVSSAAKTGNINLPKSTFDANRLIREGQIANNRRPLVKTILIRIWKNVQQNDWFATILYNPDKDF